MEYLKNEGSTGLMNSDSYTTIGQNFSNSRIMHNDKTKEIKHHGMFGNWRKTQLVFACLISPSELILFVWEVISNTP